jgi:hypothetical protein
MPVTSPSRRRSRQHAIEHSVTRTSRSVFEHELTRYKA